MNCSHNIVHVGKLLAGALGVTALVLTAPMSVFAQGQETAQQATPATREAAIEQAEAEKARDVHPYDLSEGERLMDKAEDVLANGLTWRPYFESANQGGGLPLGVAYRRYVSPFNVLDVRGSYTVSGDTRAEAELIVPHLFHRRGQLSILGGWREATQVGFYGLGGNSSPENRTSYSFRQPYASATFTLMPTRRHWTLAGGAEWTQWDQRLADGSSPSVSTVFTPQTLPGLGADVTYLHSQGTIAFDWRPSPGYARRGGYYGVTVHDYTDTNSRFGFNQIDYEAIQSFPILRETWAITLHGLAQTAYPRADQEIPFFMLPSLGGGATLRGFASWRFRDRNSVLLQAEWRIMANRFFETALFYDSGTVAARASDLAVNQLHHDYGVGFRFHGPTATLLRIDLARSEEGTRIVFAAGHVF
jgi:hypothetical protein